MSAVATARALPAAATTRSAHWDAWKGVAILAVITIHAGAVALGFPADSPTAQFGLMLRQTVNFAVPLFLAMAGYFAVGAGPAAGVPSWRQRAARLLPPYLFWTLVTVALRRPGHFQSGSLILEDVLLGKGIGIGYYVIVLLQCLLILPLILRLKTLRGHLVAMALVTAAAMGLHYSLQLGHANHPLADFPMNALPFYAWYPFFHAGVVARRFGQGPAAWPARGLALWAALFVAGVVASMVEASALSAMGHREFAASQIKLSSFAASLALFMCAVGLQGRGVRDAPPWLAAIGRRSYAIYLTHGLALTGVHAILRMDALGLVARQGLYVPLCVLLTAIACMAGIRACEALLPDSARRFAFG